MLKSRIKEKLKAHTHTLLHKAGYPPTHTNKKCIAGSADDRERSREREREEKKMASRFLKWGLRLGEAILGLIMAGSGDSNRRPNQMSGRDARTSADILFDAIL